MAAATDKRSFFFLDIILPCIGRFVPSSSPDAFAVRISLSLLNFRQTDGAAAAAAADDDDDDDDVSLLLLLLFKSVVW